MSVYPRALATLMLSLLAAGAYAQSPAAPSAQDSGQATSGSLQQPAGAVPPDSSAPPTAENTLSENPPLSSLDQPSLEPAGTSHSFLAPGLHVSGGVDSDASGTQPGLSSVTQVFGSLDLHKYWSGFDVGANYLGGGTFYSIDGANNSTVQQFDEVARLHWRRGQFSLRDSFSYLPQGLFGYGSYGGVGAIAGTSYSTTDQGAGLPAPSQDFFGPGQFASVGQNPRITNVATGDIEQLLSARTSVTASGSYGLVHFTGEDPGFVDSKQISAQAGLNHQLNRSDQISLVYGYQTFSYPDLTGGTFTTQLGNILFGHRISGRMDLIIGGGPQFTFINNPLLGSETMVSGSGRAELRYHFPRTQLALSYDRYNTSGSGIFAGATSDVGRVSVSRPLGRTTDGTFDVGLSHNSRILPTTTPFSGGPLLGTGTQNYYFGYAGVSLHKQFGRQWSGFVSYQWNYLSFDNPLCSGSPVCNRVQNRQIAIIGLDWHPRPIRLR